MSKEKRAPVYMVRRGHSLVPQMDMDGDRIAAIPEGGVVRVEIKGTRNLDRLRAYWAMLHECVEATGCQPTAEVLHEVIKIATGFMHTVHYKGLMVQFPKSIDFTSIEEDEMVHFFNTATAFLAGEYGFIGEDQLSALPPNPPPEDVG